MWLGHVDYEAGAGVAFGAAEENAVLQQQMSRTVGRAGIFIGLSSEGGAHR